MDNILLIVIAVLVIGIALYVVYRWGQHTGAPAVVKTASADIRAAEATVEKAVDKVENKAEAIVISVEDAAWAALQKAVAEVTNLEPAKQKVADAQAELAAKQKRVADLKNAVAALPQA